ncbi:phosphatase PAP2 family protein [Ornithinibacillus sp. 4-3]|uniref:Phosphatase PAP2 family protein n=1 Tax=Ornithinibacillus sp. 4-3 TaxID=3231488 RepID=A0AB39HQ34_9BACI
MESLYEIDCRIFRSINKHHHHKILNKFFRTITHLGGPVFTITFVCMLFFFTNGTLKMTALASAISLTISHLPVAVTKKLYPRQRPYLVLTQINVLANPLKDHSFPSGHTTAIFSIVTPFILSFPTWAALFIIIGLLVGISRIFLGLHYPSDVMVGIILGSGSGIISYAIVQSWLVDFF